MSLAQSLSRRLVATVRLVTADEYWAQHAIGRASQVWHFDREGNYLACLPEWCDRFPQVKWWNLP